MRAAAEKTPEEKARSKRVHATVMIVMGAITTACALAGAWIALTGGDLPAWMYGRRRSAERPAVRIPAAPLVAFAPWGPAPFARARAEGKLVLLHLTASWARQGRLMEETVYSDPRVAEAVKAVVVVRADLDERPDLALRYLRGVPTTAFLLPDERLVIAGTAMTPDLFLSFLKVVLAQGLERAKAAADKQSAGRPAAPAPRPSGGPFLPDWERLDAASWEKARRLEDPVWGGFYRYAADPEAREPEHERLLLDQARAVRALAELDPAAARRTLAFADRFLALRGGGWAGSLPSEVELEDGRVMDGRAYFALDDAGRRAAGLPRADRRLLAGPNAAMAAATLESGLATPAQEAHARRTLGLIRTRLVRRGIVARAPGGITGWIEDQLYVAEAELAAGRPVRAREVLARADASQARAAGLEARLAALRSRLIPRPSSRRSR